MLLPKFRKAVQRDTSDNRTITPPKKTLLLSFFLFTIEAHMAFTDEQRMHFKILGKRCAGILDCWQGFEDLFEGSQNVTGYSLGDDWWDDGEFVTTSTIKEFGPDKAYIITRNTVYELGRPFNKCSDEEKMKLAMNSRTTRYGRG